MHAAARRTTADEGGQGEGCAAALAVMRQAATGDRSVSQAAAMGLADELHELTSFGIGAALANVISASAMCHDVLDRKSVV